MFILILSAMISLLAAGLRWTTAYDIRPDRLLISRAGRVWATILFSDVESTRRYGVFEVLPRPALRLYRLAFGQRLSIRRRGRWWDISINPKDAQAVVDAIQRCQGPGAIEPRMRVNASQSGWEPVD